MHDKVKPEADVEPRCPAESGADTWRRTDVDPVTRAVGLDVVVPDDAVRAVDAESGDGARAVGRMRAARAMFASARTALAEE